MDGGNRQHTAVKCPCCTQLTMACPEPRSPSRFDIECGRICFALPPDESVLMLNINGLNKARCSMNDWAHPGNEIITVFDINYFTGSI